MYIKEITFTNYNTGAEEKRTFYFNLNKAELAEMDLSAKGGLKEYIERIINAKDTPELVALFKKLILMSYGVKSDDGMRFMKKDPITGVKYADEFEQTDAYSELFMELATNEQAATEFINKVIPAQLQEESAKQSGNAYPPQIAKS